MSTQSTRLAARLMVAPSVFVLFIWMIVPLAMTLYFSFRFYRLLTPERSGWVGFNHYLWFLNAPEFWLAMFNTLAMIVLEKTKDIAILRSMGYERRDITQIFLWQAGIVLAIGAFLGCLVGALSTLGVSYMPLPISGIFKTETFVVSWNIWHYVQAIATAADRQSVV